MRLDKTSDIGFLYIMLFLPFCEHKKSQQPTTEGVLKLAWKNEGNLLSVLDARNCESSVEDMSTVSLMGC
jgi:hypothetical protein